MAVPTNALPHTPSLDVHHNQNLSLQKYLLLQEQHEFLRQHLDHLRPFGGDSYARSRTAATSPTVSPVGSPTIGSYPDVATQPSPYSSRSRSTSDHRSHPRRASLPTAPRPSCTGGGMMLGTVQDESTLQELAEEEARLFDVNEGIKRALTELLNCEAVRSDQSFRTWVQCRLMDTEKELRVGRRRRSATSYDY